MKKDKPCTKRTHIKSTEVDLWQRDEAGSHIQSEGEQNRLRKEV